MAQKLDNGQLWLPAEFLTDDELLMDFQTQRFSNGYGNFNSNLGSPVESIVGSTETESDEDEFIAALTRKLAHSSLQNSNFTSDYMSKGWKLSGSPQSTLWSSYPNYGSRVSSPPEVNFELLYAAAGEVARMRLAEETAAFYSNKPSSVAVPLQNSNTGAGFYRNQSESSLSYQRLQAAQIQHMKMKSEYLGQIQFHNRRGNEGVGKKKKTGTGMRAVFLEETGAKKERTGTGVFLPRNFGTNNSTTETRKKPAGCSVLLPDRVVHALNLNLDSMDSPSHTRCNAKIPIQHDAADYRPRNNVARTTNLRTKLPVMNQELRLPQEWTY